MFSSSFLINASVLAGVELGIRGSSIAIADLRHAFLSTLPVWECIWPPSARLLPKQVTLFAVVLGGGDGGVTLSLSVNKIQFRYAWEGKISDTSTTWTRCKIFTFELYEEVHLCVIVGLDLKIWTPEKIRLSLSSWLNSVASPWEDWRLLTIPRRSEINRRYAIIFR